MTEEKNPYRSDGQKSDKLTWWQLMWKNSYLQLFGLAIAFLVVEFSLRDEFYSQLGFYIGISIPIGIMILIAYKGFMQFWRDYTKGQSR